MKRKMDEFERMLFLYEKFWRTRAKDCAESGNPDLYCFIEDARMRGVAALWALEKYRAFVTKKGRRHASKK